MCKPRFGQNCNPEFNYSHTFTQDLRGLCVVGWGPRGVGTAKLALSSGLAVCGSAILTLLDRIRSPRGSLSTCSRSLFFECRPPSYGGDDRVGARGPETRFG